jgi:hypothetical protein
LTFFGRGAERLTDSCLDKSQNSRNINLTVSELREMSQNGIVATLDSVLYISHFSDDTEVDGYSGQAVFSTVSREGVLVGVAGCVVGL